MPQSAADLVRAVGHDVDTAHAEALDGRPDSEAFAAVRREQRVLITLDHDFADVRVFPPRGSAGVIILRPRDQRTDEVHRMLNQVLTILATEAPADRLWIVSAERIRVRE